MACRHCSTRRVRRNCIAYARLHVRAGARHDAEPEQMREHLDEKPLWAVNV